jgi:antitoxin HicB
VRDEVESAAIKRVLAWQFGQAMTRQSKTKRAMAAELKTSRSQLDRLLDPKNTAVSLETLSRAAQVLGKRLVFEIRDLRPAARTAAARAETRVAGATMGKKAEVAGRVQKGRGRGFNKGAVRGARVTSGR